jgi:hypothetical protein
MKKSRLLSFQFIVVSLLCQLMAACAGTPMENIPVTPPITIIQPTLDAELKLTNLPDTSISRTVSPTFTYVPVPTKNISVTPTPSPKASQTPEKTTNSSVINVTEGVYIFYSFAESFSFWPIMGKETGWALAADYLGFANFADHMAYWSSIEPRELWVSDLALKNRKRLFTDTQSKYKSMSIYLTWSPDDLHLMVNVEENKELNLIYHVQTGVLEPWPYTCDRVALSPRSERLATWCGSINKEKGYAIIEWGGEIWYSLAGPEHELVRRGEDLAQFWAWSSDGEQIAYFDPNDIQGYLYIADSQGKVRLKTLPGSAYWLAVKAGWSLLQVYPYSPALQWSYDSSRLSVYAIGDDTNPCPIFERDSGEVLHGAPCWKVIDSLSGGIIWTITDTLDKIAALYFLTRIGPIDFLYPSISADGRFLALCYCNNEDDNRGTYVINLDTKEIKLLFENYADNIRWGPAP